MSEGYNIILSIPVVDVLSYFGKRVDHKGYMYYSPFRDESAPSMRVTVNPNDGSWIWADYGGTPAPGKHVDGGGILDMVMRLGHVTTKKAAFEILEKIAAGRGMNVIREEVRANRSDSTFKDTRIVVKDVSMDFTRKSLRHYIEDIRCIPMSVASRYCRQVSFVSTRFPNRTNIWIGFPNNAGGYALRGSGKDNKLMSVWGLSTLSPDGSPAKFTSVGSSKCILFEGFIDYLSYLCWRDVSEPGVDVCVLNSASNTVHSKKWVLNHDSVRTYFDNDRAGNEATDLVRGFCEESGKEFMDCRSLYQGFGDVNDKWVSLCQARKESEENTPALSAGIKR